MTKVICVRCESLERKQKSKSVVWIKNDIAEKIPICSVCVLEMEEEDKFIKNFLESLDDESGSESFDY